MDSIVLLDALHALAPRFALSLSALHVDHQLSPHAGRWAEFCATACAARSVPLTIARVDVARRAGQSLEAAARAARYQKLLAADADIVVLAHHADDQAETVLLQLLRGAGPAGLAAMPRHRARDVARPALLRPLLELPRSTLAAYANARGLAWIDDESNADRRHKRNMLRLEVAPLLAEAFPGYPSVLVRAAGHQAEASTLLDELARQDAGDTQDGLDRLALIALSPARARNLLRWFLRGEGLRPPSTARLAEMLAQLQTAGADARTRVVHDGAEIGCHRGRVVVHAAAAGPYARGWRGESSVELPGGMLRVFEPRTAPVSPRRNSMRLSVTLRSAPRRRAYPARGESAAACGQEAPLRRAAADLAAPGAAIHLVRRRAGGGSWDRRRAGIPGAARRALAWRVERERPAMNCAVGRAKR